MSDDTAQWLTTKEAARILRVTERMVGHYEADVKLKSRRIGRRVFYDAESVAQLAADLRVDVRPQIVRREDVNQELIRYVQEQEHRAKEWEQRTEEMLQNQRASSETNQQILER